MGQLRRTLCRGGQKVSKRSAAVRRRGKVGEIQYSPRSRSRVEPRPLPVVAVEANEVENECSLKR